MTFAASVDKAKLLCRWQVTRALEDSPSGQLSDCAEESLVELFPPAPEGELMVACRHGGKMTAEQCGAEWNASMHCRVQAFSDTGGETWRDFTPVQSLPDTPVKGGVARWEAKNAILFSNPDTTVDPCPRHCMDAYGRCDTNLGADCECQRPSWFRDSQTGLPT